MDKKLKMIPGEMEKVVIPEEYRKTIDQIYQENQRKVVKTELQVLVRSQDR